MSFSVTGAVQTALRWHLLSHTSVCLFLTVRMWGFVHGQEGKPEKHAGSLKFIHRNDLFAIYLYCIYLHTKIFSSVIRIIEIFQKRCVY